MNENVIEAESIQVVTQNNSTNELSLLGPGVSAISSGQLERDVIAQFNGECEQDEEPQPSTSKFDQLMGLADSVRFGDKTPFEQNKEDGEIDTESEDESYPDDEYVPSDTEEIKSSLESNKSVIKQYKKSIGKRKSSERKKDKLRGLPDLKDDGNDGDFEARIRQYYESFDSNEEERAHYIKHDISIPSVIWEKLYKYQKTGLRWLCELHFQKVGGILADEMGLGKTIQVICFLKALDCSQLHDSMLNFTGLGPTLIVCPATIMYQWVKELHQWMPDCRVAILHSSGSFKGSKANLLSKMVVNRKGGSVVITSYSTFNKDKKLLVSQNWHYVVLDEGHKIRNPESQISLAIRDVHTTHRIILSGSPMQNSLKELWSLIEFVFPGRLGSLKTFTQNFAIPITQGGYANATEIQTLTAYKCAIVLRDAINPYILRRMKKDVQQAIELPAKNEQVLFCDITDVQRRFYNEYLTSRECQRILKGSMDAFVGLITLRKLCNHPDLVTGGPNKHGEYDEAVYPHKQFGWCDRSGKLVVVKSLLHLWRKSGNNKVLLFSQSKQMLDILERLLILEDYKYLRMDGGTAIGNRQKLVQQFNTDSSVLVFALTTRVGGLGLNLTGANKVVIFDPDWNPSTDAQARERAWRIGQERDVTIYRLLSAGTIEEKIYHRQIFKQFLANRILNDPKQRQFFKTNDLHELFSLADKEKNSTETAELFATETTEINRENFFDSHEKERNKNRKEKKPKPEELPPTTSVQDVNDDDTESNTITDITPEKRLQLQELAKHLAHNPSLLESTVVGKNEKKKLLDGKYTVPFLKKQQKVKKTKEEKRKEKEMNELTNSTERKAQDDYVLGRLLQTAGVRSVLKHDHLVGEKPADDLIEKEAESVARSAAAIIRSRPKVSALLKLRQGRRMPEPIEENDSDSSLEDFGGNKKKESFLSAVRKRKRLVFENTDAMEEASGGVSDHYSEMAEEIRSFMVTKGGKAYSNEIVDKFKNQLGAVDPTHFRAILKKIAELNRFNKQWVLKREYE